MVGNAAGGVLMDLRAFAWAALAAMVLGGCNLSPARPCQADSDCAAGATCDTTRGACTVAAHDAACTPECAAHEQCVSSICAPRYESIALTQPANGAVVG